MSTPTEDDLDEAPEAELLTLPGEAIPPGRLTAFFTRRAEVVHQQELDELALELSGNSTRHFLIFPDMDPKERQRREEEERRRAWLAEQETLEYTQRTDRLLAQIDDQQRAIGKRRKEIDDNAIRLHDGRRVFVDGDRYRDERGRLLEGRDRDESAALHRDKPDASTWEQRQELGGEYTISTVPAFTSAALGGDKTVTAERKDTDNETPQTQNTPRAGGLKL